jgi:hypothetical protein
MLEEARGPIREAPSETPGTPAASTHAGGVDDSQGKSAIRRRQLHLPAVFRVSHALSIDGAAAK